MLARLLGYIPDLLPDELLYSFLGRLVLYNSFTNPREYLKFLFGTKNIIPSPDLPTALNALQESFATQSPFESVEHLIDSVTLYPYHRPFLTAERHERVHAILLDGGGMALKTLLGRVANRFGANPPLRFCPECQMEDVRDRETVPYWHRMHQLPGVTSCANHGIDLVPAIWLNESSDRQRFELLPATSPGAESPSHEPTEAQIAFTQISAELLNLNLPPLGPERWSAAYQVAASRDGFADANGRIRYDALAEAVRNHYDDFSGFQHRQRILSTSKHPLDWLRTVFERPNRSSHPIFHLLLIGFFFGTVESFVASVRIIPEGPHKKRKSRASLKLEDEIAPDTQLLRDQSLSARAVAGNLGISVNTVVSRRRAMGFPVTSRRKRLDAQLLTNLQNALRRGKRPSTVAREFGVSIPTVYRVRRESPAVLKASLKLQLDELRRQYRPCWVAAISKSGIAGVAEARRNDPAAYAWLYRNDRAWLVAENRRIQPAQRVNSMRVDWSVRDAQLCDKLRRVCESLKAKPGRSRITRTALIRPLGEASILRNIARLPRLKLLLDKLEESPEQFHKHRVDLAISGLRNAGLGLAWWRIQRAAGIRVYVPAVRAYALARICEVDRQLERDIRSAERSCAPVMKSTTMFI